MKLTNEQKEEIWNPYDFTDDFVRTANMVGLNRERINDRCDTYSGYTSGRIFDLEQRVNALEWEIAMLRSDISTLIMRMDILLKEFNEMKKAQWFTYVDLENDW